MHVLVWTTCPGWSEVSPYPGGQKYQEKSEGGHEVDKSWECLVTDRGSSQLAWVIWGPGSADASVLGSVVIYWLRSMLSLRVFPPVPLWRPLLSLR